MSLTSEIKADVQKFESWVKTLELKFFKGILHQKVVSPNPGETPDHAWVPVASHDTAAPAAGEQIAASQPVALNDEANAHDPATAAAQQANAAAPAA